MLYDADVERAVAAAVRAPSVHNTQPWVFHRDGDVIEVRADRTRALPAEDPFGRELLISCGGAVRHLCLGLRAVGHAVECDLLPDSLDPDLVARVRVGGAQIATAVELDLFLSVWRRRTVRSPFASEPVPDGLVEDLRRIVESAGCFLDVLGTDDSLLLATLGGYAERILQTDPARRDEQARWTVHGSFAREGVLETAPGTRGSDVPLRHFGAARPARDEAFDAEPPPAERPLLAVVGTSCDEPVDWVRAGWALSDLLLTLDHYGFAASPLTPVLELPALRALLRAGLGLVGYPQLVLRIGVPSKLATDERTGRRPVADVLR